MGRPAGQYGFPVALYNKHLANFAYKLTKLDDSQVELTFPKAYDFLEAAREFFDASIRHYSTEEDRQTACKPFLDKISGHMTCSKQVAIKRVARTRLSNQARGAAIATRPSRLYTSIWPSSRLCPTTRSYSLSCAKSRERTVKTTPMCKA